MDLIVYPKKINKLEKLQVSREHKPMFGGAYPEESMWKIHHAGPKAGGRYFELPSTTYTQDIKSNRNLKGINLKDFHKHGGQIYMRNLSHDTDLSGSGLSEPDWADVDPRVLSRSLRGHAFKEDYDHVPEFYLLPTNKRTQMMMDKVTPLTPPVSHLREAARAKGIVKSINNFIAKLDMSSLPSSRTFKVKGITVKWNKKLEEGERISGFYSPKSNEIYIRGPISPDLVWVLSHELAHATKKGATDTSYMPIHNLTKKEGKYKNTFLDNLSELSRERIKQRPPKAPRKSEYIASRDARKLLNTAAGSLGVSTTKARQFLNPTANADKELGYQQMNLGQLKTKNKYFPSNTGYQNKLKQNKINRIQTKEMQQEIPDMIKAFIRKFDMVGAPKPNKGFEIGYKKRSEDMAKLAPYYTTKEGLRREVNPHPAPPMVFGGREREESDDIVPYRVPEDRTHVFRHRGKLYNISRLSPEERERLSYYIERNSE